MLGLTKQIDVVVKEQGEAEWRVVLEVQQGEWLRTNAIWMLEEKLNAYAGFIFDGHMKSLYPVSSPDRTRVVIASVDPVPQDALDLLEKVEQALLSHGVKLSWNPEGGMATEGTPPPRGFDAG